MKSKPATMRRPAPAKAAPRADWSHIIPRQSLQAEVVSRLRDEIVQGMWPPNTRLQERILCERFGVSRSPLREAFHVLAGEHLLTLLPNRGAIVTSPTIDDAEQHFDVMVLLESRAVELACEHASKQQLEAISLLHQEMRRAATARDSRPFFELNNRVHQAIVNASNNQALIKCHQMIVRQLIRIQNLYGVVGEDRDEAIIEHDRFIAPLLKRDRTRAQAAFRAHLQTVDRMVHARLKASAKSPRT